jgi:hypothetical protein
MSSSRLWEGWKPPEELDRALPRPVRLTAGGIALCVASVLLTAGGGALGVGSASEDFRRDAEVAAAARRALAEGQETEAVVTGLRKFPWALFKSYFVGYEFTVNGRRYDAQASIGRLHWNSLAPGSPIAIRYLPSDPANNYPRADPPRPASTWPTDLFYGGTAAALGALPLLTVLRRRRLLAHGQASAAVVTGWTMAAAGRRPRFRGYYEYPLPDGGARAGTYDAGGDQPVSGSAICILYDPENPRRSAPYPLSLVKLANG